MNYPMVELLELLERVQRDYVGGRTYDAADRRNLFDTIVKICNPSWRGSILMGSREYDTSEPFPFLGECVDALRERFGPALFRKVLEQKGLVPAFDYDEYLRTPTWQRKRKAALAAARGRCQLCRNRAQLEVHHTTYENLGYEPPEDLIVLCATCHEKQHERLAKPPGKRR